MKQVDFYLISNEVAHGRLKLACRLANKLQSLGQSTLMVTPDQESLQSLDQMLWTFSDTSFVAHNEASSVGTTADLASTHIARTDQVDSDLLKQEFDVLVTLSDQVPVFSHHFSRVAEVVGADEQSKSMARERFRHYQSEGFDTKTHEITL